MDKPTWWQILLSQPNWEGLPRCERCGIYMTVALRSLGDPSKCLPCISGVKDNEAVAALDSEFVLDDILDADVIG